MEIEISLPDGSPKQAIGILKDYIEKTSIDGIEAVEVGVGAAGKGQMGLDILTSIKMIIQAAQKPLTELVKCLQKYVDNYRTRIVIHTENGESIEIDHGRSMSAEELTKFIVAIQKRNA